MEAKMLVTPARSILLLFYLLLAARGGEGGEQTC